MARGEDSTWIQSSILQEIAFKYIPTFVPDVDDTKTVAFGSWAAKLTTSYSLPDKGNK